MPCDVGRGRLQNQSRNAQDHTRYNTSSSSCMFNANLCGNKTTRTSMHSYMHPAILLKDSYPFRAKQLGFGQLKCSHEPCSSPSSILPLPTHFAFDDITEFGQRYHREETLFSPIMSLPRRMGSKVSAILMTGGDKLFYRSVLLSQVQVER